MVGEMIVQVMRLEHMFAASWLAGGPACDSPSIFPPQVTRAGPRPVRETQPLTMTYTHRCRHFSKRHRLYVGGIAKAVTQEGVRPHFAKWGNILNVYFPTARD